MFFFYVYINVFAKRRREVIDLIVSGGVTHENKSRNAFLIVATRCVNSNHICGQEKRMIWG